MATDTAGAVTGRAAGWPGAASRRRLRPVATRWGRTALFVGITAVALTPVAVVLGQALAGPWQPPAGLSSWWWHSIAVTGATVVVAMAVAVPAGYVVARGRGRATSAYARTLFVLQSLPVVFVLTPMFVLLARFGLVDLSGLTIVYIAAAVPVATWMVSTSIAEVPVALEQAAWLDGCSPVQAFVRIVLPVSAPALLSAALYTFIITWNDYLIASVFIHDQSELTLAIGLVGAGGGPLTAVVMMVPPLVAYAFGHRWFRFDGVAGALVD